MRCAFLFGLFLVLADVAFATVPESRIDEKVKSAVASTIPEVEHCCRRNGDIFVRSECRWFRCREMDELGTQLPMTDDVRRQSQDWMTSRLSRPPKGYVSKPKKTLVQDEILKRRQDCVLKVVDILREVSRYAHEQFILYGLDTGRFEALAQSYAALMDSKAWRDLGSRQGKTVENATKHLLDRVKEMNLQNVSTYDVLMAKKRAQNHAFLQRNPAAAAAVQTKIAQQEARALAVQMQNEKLEQDMIRAAEEQREQEERYIREANRRGENGEAARIEQARHDEVARRALIQATKNAERGRRQPLTSEDIKRIGTPATAVSQ